MSHTGLRPPHEAPAEHHDAVVALAHSHAALGDRAVVRLVPEPLEAAARVEMEALDFSAEAEHRGRVGYARRRALGFPAWALIHDPKHASHALSVVRRLEAAARRAHVKPGHAKTDVDAIAKELSRTVPHFLPSFYEEAARRFLGAGSARYAAQFFEKAREAERVHALDVDDEARAEVFLEFALAGAVSTKSIAAYAKDLTKARGHEAAWDKLRELAISRTLGGLPPWSSMAKDLKKLAKAARLDPAKELRAILDRILEAPALRRAPVAFWKALEKDVVAIASDSAAVRGALLRLFPDPQPHREGFDEWWLALLDRCGALEAIVAEVDEAARPAGSRASWLNRYVQHCARHWDGGLAGPGLFELMERAAPPLIEAGESFVAAGRYDQLDLDLLEHALALGLPLSEPPPHTSIDLRAWTRMAHQEQRGRDPVRTGADPRFAKALEDAVSQQIGDAAFDRLAAPMQGFTAARRAWLTRALETPGGGLLELEERLAELDKRGSPELFAELEGSLDRLAEFDVGAALARTLRGGVLDELGWPALEEAADKLGLTADAPPSVLASTWPYVIVGDAKRQIVVVGPDAIVLEHEPRLPKEARLALLRFVDGQLLVAWQEGMRQRGYWSSAPHDVLDLSFEQWAPQIGGYTAAVEGGVSEGGRALRVGDTRVARAEQILTDGETVWRREHRSDGPTLVEVDPATGETGRRSMPAFLEEWAEDGWTLNLWLSQLAALPEGWTESPLGARDGLVGWRGRQRANGSGFECEGIDGRRPGPQAASVGTLISSVLSFPGGVDAPLAPAGYGVDITLLTGGARSTAPGGARPWDRAGTPILVPLIFWHFLRPRDPAGSAALRATDDDAARALLEEDSAPLAGLEHPALVAGVQAIVEHARRLQRRLSTLCLASAGGGAEGSTLSDDEVRLVDSELLRGWQPGNVADQARQVAAAMMGEPSTEPHCGVAFWELPRMLDGLAYRAVAYATPDAQREVALRLLELWAELPFIDSGSLRSWQGEVDRSKLGAPLHAREESRWGVVRQGTSVYYLETEWADGSFEVVEWASGEPQVPPWLTVESTDPQARSTWDAESIRAFVALARERGKMPWREEAPEAIAEATGLDRAQAALLYAGLPGMDSWESKFLPDDLREAIGLKVREAAKARDALRQTTDVSLRGAVFEGAVGDDPLALYEGEAPWAPLVASWLRVVPKRIEVPPAIEAGIEATLGHAAGRDAYLLAILEPESSPMMRPGRVWQINAAGDLEDPPDESDDLPLEASTLAALTRLCRLFSRALPVGDALRARVGPTLRALQALVREPTFLLSADYAYLEDEADRTRMLSGLGDAPYVPVGTGEPRARSRDTGAIIAVENEWGAVSLAVRPSGVDDWDGVAKLVAAQSDVEPIREARWLLEGGADAWLARLESSPVPTGGSEMDPRASAPEVLDAVRDAHSISEDAAALYLVTLAWLDPSDKAVRAMFDWKPKPLKSAITELVEAKLVVQAKRARAGRKHFLPGGWEALKAPHAPLETWKLALFGFERAADFGYLRHEPREPPHVRFAKAWARIEAGDVPRYEEVKK